MMLKWDDDEGSARDITIDIFSVSNGVVSLWGMGANVSIHRSTPIAYNETRVCNVGARIL